MDVIELFILKPRFFRSVTSVIIGQKSKAIELVILAKATTENILLRFPGLIASYDSSSLILASKVKFDLGGQSSCCEKVEHLTEEQLVEKKLCRYLKRFLIHFRVSSM